MCAVWNAFCSLCPSLLTIYTISREDLQLLLDLQRKGFNEVVTTLMVTYSEGSLKAKEKFLC